MLYTSLSSKVRAAQVSSSSCDPNPEGVDSRMAALPQTPLGLPGHVAL